MGMGTVDGRFKLDKSRFMSLFLKEIQKKGWLMMLNLKKSGVDLSMKAGYCMALKKTIFGKWAIQVHVAHVPKSILTNRSDEERRKKPGHELGE